jgi:hypothetical protein
MPPDGPPGTSTPRLADMQLDTEVPEPSACRRACIGRRPRRLSPGLSRSQCSRIIDSCCAIFFTHDTTHRPILCRLRGRHDEAGYPPGTAGPPAARLDGLSAEEQAIKMQEDADMPPTPDVVAEWAKTLDVALYSGSAQQRKALIRKLVKELRVMSRDEIIPTYRVPALVRAREI